MRQPLVHLSIAGGRWTDAPGAPTIVGTGRPMPWVFHFGRADSQSAFHFLELSFPKVDFFFWGGGPFHSFPKLVSGDRVPLSDPGMMAWNPDGWPSWRVPRTGNSWIQCVLPGVVLFFFFLHEIKSWCCQKMIVSIWLCVYFKTSPTIYAPVATSTSAHDGGN